MHYVPLRKRWRTAWCQLIFRVRVRVRVRVIIRVRVRVRGITSYDFTLHFL